MSLRMRIDSPGDLEAFALKLDELKRGQYEAAIHKAIAPAATAALQEEFFSGVGPDGKGWAKKKNGEQSNLTATGGMKGSTRAIPLAKRTELSVAGSSYFHQRGTRHMKARPILPKSGRMPALWASQIDPAGSKAFEEWLQANVIV